MSVTMVPPPKLGNVGEALCAAFAYRCSPSRIDWEIAHLQHQLATGERRAAVAAQLSDWRAMRDKQRALFAAAVEEERRPA